MKNHPHLEYPHCLHTVHPPSRIISAPHSGHLSFESSIIVSLNFYLNENFMTLCFPVFEFRNDSSVFELKGSSGADWDFDADEDLVYSS